MTIDVVWAGARYTCTPVVEPEPEPPPVIPEPPRVIAFSQRDARWASYRLGTSAYTMGGAGCAVTAVTMVGTTVQPSITPGDMVTWLNANGGFTSGGLLYWQKAADFAGLEWVGYSLWRDVPADLVLLGRALAVGPQVVQVDFKPLTSTLDSHFVTALSFTADGLDLNIVDPWTGARGTLLATYAQPGWTLSRAVYALAEFGAEA